MPTSMHPFFQSLSIRQLSVTDFDATLAQHPELTGVFFWGKDCPNCEVAKNTLTPVAGTLEEFGLTWFHVNVYADSELGTRFGLMGIPTFYIFFAAASAWVKISPFPGVEAFFEALRGLKAK